MQCLNTTDATSAKTASTQSVPAQSYLIPHQMVLNGLYDFWLALIVATALLLVALRWGERTEANRKTDLLQQKADLEHIFQTYN